MEMPHEIKMIAVPADRFALSSHRPHFIDPTI
jgi:hypothetical protein